MATLYRNWSSSDTTVSTHYNAGGTFPRPNNIYDDDHGNTPQDWTKDGYYFTGWNTSSDGTGDRYQAADWIISDTNFYATWAELTHDVTISYDNSTIATMDASGVEILDTIGKYMSDNITVEYNKPGTGVTTVSFSSGAVFTGSKIWYVDGDGVAHQTTTLAQMSQVDYQMLSKSLLVWFDNVDPEMSGAIISLPAQLTLAYSTSVGARPASYLRLYQVA